jgi:hypothetical protein
MRPTDKWNEELPLKPRKPLPPPRRFEIDLDGRKSLVVIKQTHFPGQGPQVKWVPGKTEIKGGTSLREDELREYAHDMGTDALIVDSMRNIHRPGENIAPAGVSMSMGSTPGSFPTYVGSLAPRFPGGIVVSRARLRQLAAEGRLKNPQNLVNSFRPGRLVHRKKNFPAGLARQALSLTNPGAYHGIAVSPASRIAKAVASGYVVVSGDGTVYARRKTELGWSPFKKVGKLVKKATKVVTRPIGTVARVATKPVASAARATGRGLSTAARSTGRGVTVAAKATGKGVAAAGKGVAKAGKWVALQAARAAASPITIPINRMIATVASKKRIPKATAKKQVLASIARKGGPFVVATKIYNFVSGATIMGAVYYKPTTAMGFDPATITAIASATGATLLAMSKEIVTNLLKEKAQQTIQSAASNVIDRAVPPPQTYSPEPTPQFAPAPQAYYPEPAPAQEAYAYNYQAQSEEEPQQETAGMGLITFGCYERR